MKPPDEAHRDQHRKDGEGGGHDRAEDLARALEHRFLEAESHGAVALDVLRDHDRIVHDDADRDDQREQGHQVQGEAGQPVEHRGGGQRDGNRQDHGERRVELAQEEKDDEGDDQPGDEQLPVGRVDRGLDRTGGVVGDDERVPCGQVRLLQQLPHPLHHGDRVGIGGPLDGDQDRRLPVHAGKSRGDRPCPDGADVAHRDSPRGVHGASGRSRPRPPARSPR